MSSRKSSAGDGKPSWTRAPMTGKRRNGGSMAAAPRKCAVVFRNCAFMAVVWLGQVSEIEMLEGHSRISLVIILT